VGTATPVSRDGSERFAGWPARRRGGLRSGLEGRPPVW